MANKETFEIVDLTEKINLVITKKGADLPENDWKEGEVVTLHPNLAKSFIEKGFAKEGSKNQV